MSVSKQDYGRPPAAERAKITEWGNSIPYGYVPGGGFGGADVVRYLGLSALDKYLRADAEKTLPPNTRYEIRESIPGNFGRSHGRAWYANSEMANDLLWRDCEGYDQRAGYVLLGRYTTPAVKTGQPITPPARWWRARR